MKSEKDDLEQANELDWDEILDQRSTERENARARAEALAKAAEAYLAGKLDEYFDNHQPPAPAFPSRVQRGLNSLSSRDFRTVSFPKNWSMGTVYTVSNEHEIWDRNGWEEIGYAQGSIVVQPLQKLILEIGFRKYQDGYFTDLSPLTALRPDDLQGLDLMGMLDDCREEIGVRHSLNLISKLTGLEWVRVVDTAIGSLSFVEQLSELKGLNVNHTDVCSLRPLGALTKLRYLDLSNTEVLDIEFLEDLTNLEELDLSETAIGSLVPLYGLSKLDSLSLGGTMYTEDDEEVKRLRCALPDCYIWL